MKWVLPTVGLVAVWVTAKARWLSRQSYGPWQVQLSKETVLAWEAVAADRAYMGRRHCSCSMCCETERACTDAAASYWAQQHKQRQR